MTKRSVCNDRVEAPGWQEWPHGPSVLAQQRRRGGSCSAAAPATMAGPPNKVGVIQIQAALAATKEGQKAGGRARSQDGAARRKLEGEAIPRLKICRIAWRRAATRSPTAAKGRPDAQYRRQDQEL